MKIDEFIKKFVCCYEIESNRYSCLMLALKDARKLTARNIETGKWDGSILENENSFLNPYAFIGIINYLLILDMIGEIFTVKNKQSKIYRALDKYGSLKEEKDKQTIVALRNSLAHNYALVNIPDSSKNYLMQRHRFELINSENFSLIEYPIKPWNGDFFDLHDDSFTKIGLGQLIELIEGVYHSLTMEIELNPVNIVGLNGGVEELKARFTIRT